jgi:hypothetical protein
VRDGVDVVTAVNDLFSVRPLAFGRLDSGAMAGAREARTVEENERGRHRL